MDKEIAAAFNKLREINRKLRKYYEETGFKHGDEILDLQFDDQEKKMLEADKLHDIYKEHE